MLCVVRVAEVPQQVLFGTWRAEYAVVNSISKYQLLQETIAGSGGGTSLVVTAHKHKVVCKDKKAYTNVAIAAELHDSTGEC